MCFIFNFQCMSEIFNIPVSQPNSTSCSRITLIEIFLNKAYFVEELMPPIAEKIPNCLFSFFFWKLGNLLNCTFTVNCKNPWQSDSNTGNSGEI